jgi:diguanylate cyclase (GGDEF)-like protein
LLIEWFERIAYSASYSGRLTMAGDTQSTAIAQDWQSLAEYGVLIAQHCPEAMAITDDVGEIKFINPAAEQLFGKSSDEMIGQLIEYPLNLGDSQEVRVVRPNQDKRVVDMHVTRAEIHGQSHCLITFRDVTDRVRHFEELRLLSLTDELTGLCNRRGFFTLAEQQLKIARRTKKEMMLLLADMDKLKVINDNFGHPEGDKAISAVARVLKETFRESDILARIGGDEFAVLAVESSGAVASAVDKRLKEKLAELNDKSDKQYEVSISRAIAPFNPWKPSTLEELVDWADVLLMEQKKRKKVKR